jgi:hypothetical protein
MKIAGSARCRTSSESHVVLGDKALTTAPGRGAYALLGRLALCTPALLGDGDNGPR